MVKVILSLLLILLMVYTVYDADMNPWGYLTEDGELYDNNLVLKGHIKSGKMYDLEGKERWIINPTTGGERKDGKSTNDGR